MPTYCWKCCQCESTKIQPLTLSQLEDHETHPTCCGEKMRRDYHAEGAKLSEESRDKGRFPHVYENLGPEPVEVQSNAHLRQIMKEKGLVRHEPDDDARARFRDRTRRFY